MTGDAEWNLNWNLNFHFTFYLENFNRKFSKINGNKWYNICMELEQIVSKVYIKNVK